jgi:hypothetical protein
MQVSRWVLNSSPRAEGYGQLRLEFNTVLLCIPISPNFDEIQHPPHISKLQALPQIDSLDSMN